MTATILTEKPVPVCGWGNDTEWLEARNCGISASDVAACLGYGQYCTPWEVWAEKTGLRPRSVDANKEAIRLGVALEPWLLVQAGHLIGVKVKHTEHRLYAHPTDRWQLASPDGIAIPTDGEPYGIEAKTAGLAGGFGVPKGWDDDRVPLGYEFQARWQMRVMGWRKVVIVALVANLGLRTYVIRRDHRIELDMVEQVREWYDRHVVGRVEPPLMAQDSDLLNDIYPTPAEGHLPLDDNRDIVELVMSYQDAAARSKASKVDKETAEAGIKRILGNHCAGTIDGREIVTWKERRSNIRWADFVRDLYETGGWDPDDVETDAEPYRNQPTRSLSIKGIK